jgi:hypothetical protein
MQCETPNTTSIPVHGISAQEDRVIGYLENEVADGRIAA